MLAVVEDAITVLPCLLVALVVVGKAVVHLAHQRVIQQMQDNEVQVVVEEHQETT
jgi:uncharacterized membrane protein YjgN (DUF898 family)